MSERLKSAVLNWFKKPSTNTASSDYGDPQLVSIMKKMIQSKSGSEQWIPHRFTVSEDLNGLPLSTAMASQFDLPRSFLQKLVAKHDVQVQRTTGQHSFLVKYGIGMTVKTGDVVTVTGAILPLKKDPIDWKRIESQSLEFQKQALTALVLYEDDKIMAINKPSGLSVQPGPEVMCSLDKLLKDHINADLRLVHRLDKDASGVLLVAKNGQVAQELRSRLDEAHIDPQIEKIYWAMTAGKPEMAFGEIYSSIYLAGKYPKERMTSHFALRTSLLDGGKAAISQWRHLGTYVKRHKSGRRIKLSLLEMRPITGRKHQLRVHCAEQLKMPILGDAKYGFDKLKSACISPRPLHLHCYQVRLTNWFDQNSHEGKSPDLTITAPIPKHFIKTMDDFPLFLPKLPKLKKPQFPSNVRRLYQRTLN